MNAATREAGFGREVKRRIMLGTYALSAGYYDAYYGQAQRVRTLIIRDFERAYEQFDVLLAPTSPTVAFELGAKTADPLAMYLCDVCTIPSNLAGHAGDVGAVRDAPDATRAACRSACRCSRPRSASRDVPGRAGDRAGRSGRCRRHDHDRDAASGKPSSGSRCTASSRPRPSCSAAARTSSATSRTPTSARCASACPVRCRCSTRTAVEYALRVAEALHLRVPEHSIFSRKNYFYPDMPKDYQTSQYDEPITIDGWLDVDGVRVGITRAHLEEDTGKSMHVGGGGRIHDADHSLVDYNRAGVPLLEIVSEPDIRSAEQAKRYVEELRATLLAVGVSDVKMEEGSLRIDANVSVRPVGSSEFGTRAEIKNLNSLRSLLRAIDYEAERQSALIEAGERVVQETRHWDEDGGRTISGRSKEEAHDYRYFPEPDLVPVAPTDEMRERVRASMPELPAARRARLIDEWGIKEDDARVLVDVPGLADYAEQAVAALEVRVRPKDVANWARQEVLGFVNDRGLSPAVLDARDARRAGRARRRRDDLARSGEGRARRVDGRGQVARATSSRTRGLAQVSDAGELGAVVERVLAANADDGRRSTAPPKTTRARKKKRNALMGKIMGELKGKGNAQVVNALLDTHLDLTRLWTTCVSRPTRRVGRRRIGPSDQARRAARARAICVGGRAWSWCRTRPAARGRRSARGRSGRSCRGCPAPRTRRPSRR